MENTKRPELASVYMDKEVDTQYWLTHVSGWSMAKQHYLAAKARQDGLQTKVAQLELVCFNLSIGVSNNFNIVFRLTSSCGVLFINYFLPRLKYSQYWSPLTSVAFLLLSHFHLGTLTLRFLIEKCLFTFGPSMFLDHDYFFQLKTWLKFDVACSSGRSP